MTGQRPAGWAKDRFAWRKAVIADTRLGATSKLLANELAFGFSNHETGECSPGIPALMGALSCCKRTVLRALAELVARRWLARRGGNAPGKRAVYVFRMQGEQVTGMTPEQVTGLSRTGDSFVTPPKPPYMDEPNMNQRTMPQKYAPKVRVPGGVRPVPFSQCVEFGSDAETAWAEWLKAEGFPSLDKIGLAHGVTQVRGWDMPNKWPPGLGDEVGRKLARRFAEWLMARA